MKRIRLVLVIVLLVALGPPVRLAVAGQEKLDPGCSAASLKGTYGFNGQGFSGRAPMAWVGVFNFDGTGNFSGYHDESIDGTVASATEAGDYSVDPDCHGVIHWTNHRHTNLPGDLTHTFKFVVVDGGKEAWLLGVDTSHPNMDLSKVPQAEIVFWSSLKQI